MHDLAGFLHGQALPPRKGGGALPARLNTFVGREPAQQTSSAAAAAPAFSSDDLLKFLDELTSGPGIAPPPATSASLLAHIFTGLPSPSLSVPVHAASMSLFAPTSSSSEPAASNGLGFDPSSLSLSFSLSEEQAKPQQSANAFASASKPFDAGDILLPFDLEPSTTSGPLDVLAFPVFDTAINVPYSSARFDPASVSASTAAVDPLALDAMLDSPLGLASTSTSPLSEFLASPMLSIAGESGVPCSTMEDLPLPSPYDPMLSAPQSASADGPSLPWFPPMPATVSSSLLFGASPAPTVLRPLPPIPSPSLPLVPPAPSLPPASTVALHGTKRPAPTGFRPGSAPLLPLDAPIQSRHSVIPSATSKRRKTSAAEKALAKRGRGVSATSAPAPAPAPAAGEEEGEDDLPQDIVAAVERKRLQNTLSARKSRARKQARMQELEGENEALRRRVGELEALLGLAAAGAGAA